MSPDGVAELLEVIERLEAAQPLALDEAARMSRAHRKNAIQRMVEEGIGWAAATGDLAHLDRPDAVEFVASIKDDLAAQVGIFSRCVDGWFDHGSHPAPGYTWRITVILRKAKLFEIESRFLAVYFRHFYTPRGSSRDRDLSVRAIKIGIDLPAPIDTSPLPLP